MISGGERQRIAVARAFLRDAPILILDEPTSSIDSRTESVILDALDRLMEGRTTIMIAHRLSTLRSVDEILVLDDGEIVQRGSHEQLAEQDGPVPPALGGADAGTGRRRPGVPAGGPRRQPATPGDRRRPRARGPPSSEAAAAPAASAAPGDARRDRRSSCWEC